MSSTRPQAAQRSRQAEICCRLRRTDLGQLASGRSGFRAAHRTGRPRPVCGDDPRIYLPSGHSVKWWVHRPRDARSAKLRQALRFWDGGRSVACGCRARPRVSSNPAGRATRGLKRSAMRWPGSEPARIRSRRSRPAAGGPWPGRNRTWSRNCGGPVPAHAAGRGKADRRNPCPRRRMIPSGEGRSVARLHVVVLQVGGLPLHDPAVVSNRGPSRRQGRRLPRPGAVARRGGTARRQGESPRAKGACVGWGASVYARPS